MTRYQQLFKKITLEKRGAFVPFITLGDPNFNSSVNIIKLIIESGADALELGIPFSDPLADGKKIQNSFQRALNAKIKIDDCFRIIKIIREQYQNIPIGLLTYANLTFKNGIDKFYSYCAQYDVDSVLIADLPIKESSTFRKIALKNNIDQIFTCPPNANNTLLKKIIKYSQSYIYLISYPGVTGNLYSFHTSLNVLIQDLKKYKSPPILQGFGISDPNQAKKALLSGVNGVISGSSIAEIIEKNIHNQKMLLNKLKKFICDMQNVMK